MRPERLLGVAIAAALLAPTAASAECPAEAVADVDARLTREARKARRWNYGWMAGYGLLTAGQLGLVAAEWAPGDEFDDAKRAALVLGAAKSGIGMLSRIVLPLKIAPRSGEGDPCVAASFAIDAAGAEERTSFWLNLAGGVVLNVAGLIILGTRYDDWGEGLLSFGLGLPVALLANYTHPRAAWRGDWTIAVDRAGDRAGVSLATTW